MNNALKTILESAEALNENGLQVLALIAGVIRQVAPSQAVESVELPETETVESSAAVESVAEPLLETETVAPESPVALPETEPPVEPAQAVAPSSPTYRLVLNVPEIGLKGFAD